MGTLAQCASERKRDRPAIEHRLPSLALRASILAMLMLLSAARERSSAQEQAAGPGITNSIGMQLVRIPAGEFFMGGTESAEELCQAFASYQRQPAEFSDEYPRHKVQITRPFWLGRYEVTVGQFRRFTSE